MKIVDRHLSGHFLGLFALSLGTFAGLFLVVDFFEKLRMILKYEAGAGDTLLYFAARLPWALAQVIPVATLLGTLLSAALLARHGEITALRCSGVSLGRLVRPYLLCGLALSLVTGFIQEVAAPRGFAYAREVKEVRIKKRPPASLLRTEDLWLRAGPRILHVVRAGPEEGRLTGLTVAEVEGSRVTRRIDAAEARWDGSGWILLDAEVRTFEPGAAFATRQVPSLAYPLELDPADFRIEDLRAEEASWAELRRKLGRYRAQGLETRDLEVGLWAKTSLPFVNLVMPLLAFPFAIGAGRRGGASAGVVLAVGLGLAYWLTLAVGLSLGKAGALPPPVAAWAGNLLFAGVGAALLRREERGA